MPRLYRFGEFELQPDEGEIRTKDSSIRLQEKPLLLLLVLLENSHRLVTRTQLRERMWPGDTFVDYEQGINVAIKKVRDALGDAAEQPQFVETIPRKGYRFLVNVEVVDEPATKPTRENAQAHATPADAPAPKTFASRWLLRLALTVAVLFAALGAWRFRPRPIGRDPGQFNAIAVLPLRNLSPDAGQEYLV